MSTSWPISWFLHLCSPTLPAWGAAFWIVALLWLQHSRDGIWTSVTSQEQVADCSLSSTAESSVLSEKTWFSCFELSASLTFVNKSSPPKIMLLTHSLKWHISVKFILSYSETFNSMQFKWEQIAAMDSSCRESFVASEDCFVLNMKVNRVFCHLESWLHWGFTVCYFKLLREGKYEWYTKLYSIVAFFFSSGSGQWVQNTHLFLTSVSLFKI